MTEYEVTLQVTVRVRVSPAQDGSKGIAWMPGVVAFNKAVRAVSKVLLDPLRRPAALVDPTMIKGVRAVLVEAVKHA